MVGLLAALKRMGLPGTVAFIVSYVVDLMFDWKHGTDTGSWVALRKLDIRSENLERGVDYRPTQIYPLRRLLRALAIPKGKTLVDLGCGKGRVLLVAAEFGFSTLRGIEFSPELCGMAKKNCEVYTLSTATQARFEIVESDVLDYDFHDEDVIFLFNPFDAHVLSLVLRNVVTSLEEHERPIWIIYRNPRHRKVIEQTGAFNLVMDFVSTGSDFLVYASAKQGEAVSTGL